MKKLLSFGFLLLLATVTVSAQKTTFGIRGGLSFATIMEQDDNESYDEYYNYWAFFYGGFYVDFPITATYSIETGINYVQKGNDGLHKIREEKYNSNIFLSSQIYLNYLEVPITIKATLPLSEKIRIYAAPGFYFGYLMNGSISVSSLIDKDFSIGSSSGDDIKRGDFGAYANVGFEFGRVSLGATYSYGFANISPEMSNGLKVKNRCFQTYLGIRIN